MNGTFPDGVPADMMRPTTGTVFTQTFGWTHISASALWVLIPGTLVGLITIVVVLATVAQHAGDPPNEPFDPADARHLVTASAAGGLDGAFTGTNGEDIEAGERINIVLGSLPGRGPALIRTGNVNSQFA
jgi:hypothetical protein